MMLGSLIDILASCARVSEETDKAFEYVLIFSTWYKTSYSAVQFVKTTAEAAQ